MKKLMIAALVFGGMFSSALATAQEMSFRRGVVTGIAPIQVQAQAQTQTASSGSTATGGALGRAFGRALGRVAAKAGGEYGYEAANVASSVVQDVASTPRSSPAAGGTVAAYVIMIRFDNGSESAIQAASANGLRVGGKVNVIGSGSATQVVPAG